MFYFRRQVRLSVWVIVARPAFYDFCRIDRMRIVWCKRENFTHIHPIRRVLPCGQRVVPLHAVALSFYAMLIFSSAAAKGSCDRLRQLVLLSFFLFPAFMCQIVSFVRRIASFSVCAACIYILRGFRSGRYRKRLFRKNQITGKRPERKFF